MGTTLGMMLANVPVVLFGEWLVQRLPVRRVQIVCAVLFAVMGAWTLANVGHLLPG